MSIDSRAKGAALGFGIAGVGSVVLITIGVMEPDALPSSVYNALAAWVGAVVLASAVLLHRSAQPPADVDSSRAVVAEIGRLRSSEREMLAELVRLRDRVAAIEGPAMPGEKSYEEGYDEGFLAALGRRDS